MPLLRCDICGCAVSQVKSVFVCERCSEGELKPGDPGYDWTDIVLARFEIKALRARVAELETAQRWIPVTERLPELEPGNTTKTIRVLCTYIRYDVRVVFESVWDEAWQHFYWDYAADYPATFRAPDFTNGNERLIAWQYMPLPQPPEEVEG